jgi:hypothetical protein
MTGILNRVVEHWRKACKRQKQRHSLSTSSISNKNFIIQAPTPSQLLDQLLTWKTMEPMLLVGAFSYNYIMLAALDDFSVEETSTFCESIFRKMISSQASSFVDRRIVPNSYTYELLLKSWSNRTGDLNTMEHLWSLFNEMQQLHKDGILEMPLNENHYTIVMHAFMRTNQIDWMNRAEQLFQQMRESTTLTPDQSIYTCYLRGWLSLKGLTLEQWQRCKAVLNDALEQSKACPQKPLVNASEFKYLMEAAFRMRRNDLVEQSFAELCKWHSTFPVPSMAPSVRCLSTLMRTYARTHRPDQAEQILFSLIQDRRGKIKAKWTPKAFHFEEIIKCWLKLTATNDGLERAGQLLLHAVELDQEFCLDLSCDYLYWIISAWAQSGRHDAPSRAAALLEAFRSRSKELVRKDCLQLVEKMQSPSFQRK